MKNPGCTGYAILAAALVLSLLTAPFTAGAAGEYLSQFSSDNYLGLEDNTSNLWVLTDSESSSDTAVAAGEYLNNFSSGNYLGLQDDESDFWAQTDGESASGSEAGSEQAPVTDASQLSAKELSQESANPIGRFAYIFTQFAATMSDGDLNTGDHHYAGSITFQPIIPIPLYGSGQDEWRIVTRPTINLFLDQPIPDSGRQDDFDRSTGVSDLLIPLPLALPDRISGRWLLALGPSFSLPTASKDDFGKEQWCAGVSGVFGYISKNWMAGFYPQTYFRIADHSTRSSERGARFGNMFYWFFYNITDDTQIGWSPTIQWNDKAGSGNKWNVPFGPSLAKVTKWGNQLIRIELGAEISVVREDDYGEVGRIKVNLIPVVPRPIKKAIFGGN